MKRLTPTEREHLLSRLAERYELRLPILLPDGTRTIGSPDDGPLALLGGAVPGKPTAAFFPQQEAIFTADHSTFSQSPPPVKPLCILGFTPADLHCLRFIDRFFADGFRDDLYFRLRQGAVVAGISGYCGTGGALLSPAGGNCDFELFWSGENWLVTAYGEIGTELVAELPDCTTVEEELVARSITTEPDSGAILLQTASQLLRTDRGAGHLLGGNRRAVYRLHRLQPGLPHLHLFRRPRLAFRHDSRTKPHLGFLPTGRFHAGSQRPQPPRQRSTSKSATHSP